MIDGNGLYYMRARYYNVDIKRFINQDVLIGTLERISSLNRFSYVEGNPISYLDPFGLERSLYDEWHEYLQAMMTVYSGFSAAIAVVTTMLHKPIKEKGLDKAIKKADAIFLLDVLWIACMDVGVCMGRAWEGVFEGNMSKIQSSYDMMGEVFNSLVVSISAILLDDYFDIKAFGFLDDFSAFLDEYEDLGL